MHIVHLIVFGSITKIKSGTIYRKKTTLVHKYASQPPADTLRILPHNTSEIYSYR